MRALILIALLTATTAHAELSCYGMGCESIAPVMELPVYQPQPDPIPAEIQPLYPNQGASCNFHTDCNPGQACIKRPLDYMGVCR